MTSDNWLPLRIGAGGYLTGIDIAPDDTMVVRTDTYGAYIWNGSEWQQLVTSLSMPAANVDTGNAEGVYEIRIAPSNTNILYMEYLGQVYRSSDKGATWTDTNFAHVVQDPNDTHRVNGQKMAVDPINPDVVYAGTGQDGLFVTMNGGTSWDRVSALPPSALDTSSGLYPGISGITFDPTSGTAEGKTNVIYAASYGSGVYRTDNGGASWSLLTGGPTDVEYATISSTGAYYVIGDHHTSIWRYMDGGWTNLTDTANTSGLETVAVDPFNASHIIVQTGAGNIEESLDRGETWSGINWRNQVTATDIPWLAHSTGELTQPFMSIGGLVFDPVVPQKLWASAGTGVWNTTLPENFTWLSPVVWNSQSVGIEQLGANDIVVPTGGHPVVASWDRSFFYVNDPDTYPSTYGVANQPGFAAGWSLDYASTDHNFVVGIADWWGTQESGYSTDGGKTWQVFPSFPPFATEGGIGGTIAASSPTNIVWAPADNFTPYYTKDGGVTWAPVVLPDVSDWHDFHFAYFLDKTTVTADRVLPDTFYMYYNGVYKTTDGGDTWTKVFNGEISLFSGFNSQIEAVPGEAGNLFFTGGPWGLPEGDTHPAPEGFYHSKDGGATWTAVPDVLEVLDFGFGAPAHPGEYPSIYIVGWVNNIYGIWQSDDEASSWAQIGLWPNDSLDTIKTITGDPDIYGQVYVGFTGSGYAYLPGGTAGTEVNHAPVVTVPDPVIKAAADETFQLSDLFTANDQDGDALTYIVKDSTPGGGHFLLNGVEQPANQSFNLTAAQLAQTTFVPAVGSSDDLMVRASDGHTFSGWSTIHIDGPVNVNAAPNVLLPHQTIVAAPGQTLQMSDLMSAAHEDGDVLDFVLYDFTPGGGHFVVNGEEQATVQIMVTAAQLAQTTFVTADAGSDDLLAFTTDGQRFSNITTFHIESSTVPSGWADLHII